MEGGELNPSQIINEMQRLYTPENIHHIFSNYERREKFSFRGLKLMAFSNRLGIKNTQEQNAQSKESIAFATALRIWPKNPLLTKSYEAAVADEHAYDEKMAPFRALTNEDLYRIGRENGTPQQWVAASETKEERENLCMRIFGSSIYQVYNKLGLKYPNFGSPKHKRETFLEFALKFHKENAFLQTALDEERSKLQKKEEFDSLKPSEILEGLRGSYSVDAWLELSDSTTTRRKVVFAEKNIDALAKKFGYKFIPTRGPIYIRSFFLKLGFERLWPHDPKLQIELSRSLIAEKKKDTFETIALRGDTKEILSLIQKKYSVEDFIAMSTGYHQRSCFDIMGAKAQRVASSLGLIDNDFRPLNNRVDFLDLALFVYPNNEKLQKERELAQREETERQETKEFLEQHTPESLAAFIRESYTEQMWVLISHTFESRRDFSIHGAKIAAIASALSGGSLQSKVGATAADFLRTGLLVWKNSSIIQSELSSLDIPVKGDVVQEKEYRLKHMNAKKLFQYIRENFTPDIWIEVASSPEKLRAFRILDGKPLGVATILGKNLHGYEKPSSNPKAFLDLGTHIWPEHTRLRQAFESVDQHKKQQDKKPELPLEIHDIALASYTPERWLELAKTKEGRTSVDIKGLTLRAIARVLGMPYPSGKGPLQLPSAFIKLGLHFWPEDETLIAAYKHELTSEMLH